jgi:hypothetical protein
MARGRFAPLLHHRRHHLLLRPSLMMLLSMILLVQVVERPVEATHVKEFG